MCAPRLGTNDDLCGHYVTYGVYATTDGVAATQGTRGKPKKHDPFLSNQINKQYTVAHAVVTRIRVC